MTAFQFNNIKNFFFVGIAGTGMSAIAQYLKSTGNEVSGSDRLFDSDDTIPLKEQFEKMGICCFSQDASGINDKTEAVIISSAIEETNIEYIKAVQLGIPIIKRSELLASISKEKRTIAVGGTSGKSTTTAMIFHIMMENGFSPSLMTGAGLSSLQEKGLPGNAWAGESEWLVIEADESDGSIVSYKPEISIVLNIDRDHKEYDELLELFNIFKKNTSKQFIVNSDYPLVKQLSENKEYDFGTSGNIGFVGSDFIQKGFSICFKVNGIQSCVPVIGRHNMENAIAAVAVCAAAGISVEHSAKALSTYKGIYRRTQLVGSKNDIYVIDDFAHNPSEVSAAIKACQDAGNRVIAWFQPHGFGPLRFMYEELIVQIDKCLREHDIILMSDVYYAGGTVNKDINSDIVINALVEKSRNAFFIPNRSDMLPFINKHIKPRDVVLLMGARDVSLGDFAVEVLKNIPD